ncbi:uncharacterized protein MONOS_12682 [Monocercomonoides exilis]|uniref:uncharacterized protein n=1 Tax=Monocercomonoides exilis TaxID=2049356 RepID=UPI00355A829D|nr:hypothetical protein MONOS_12682 [Monocercomonoides exilis]|eukprot:MONOS_12682.1-p1 / transcript=MONOS_12682.1 / gene=MONOS_12682 / organism=Monocercomonoides_exilis_PA203 / gene_product=unspecified product / transcript_product=unspecified product / location=Mono_scaffold00718:23333-23872(-) / protein_length=180 / sequence_SO=supercontig / SO=protein_coding / is_pseudo=false
MQQDTVHLPTPQQVSGLQRPEVDPRKDIVREGASRDSNTDSSREGDTEGASQISGERREFPSSKLSSSQPSLGGQSLSLDLCHQLPQGHKEGQLWNQQLVPTNGRRSKEEEGRERVEREERAALYHETERGERESNYSEMTTQQETAALFEMRSETEVSKQYVNIRETLSSLDQRKKRE